LIWESKQKYINQIVKPPLLMMAETMQEKSAENSVDPKCSQPVHQQTDALSSQQQQRKRRRFTEGPEVDGVGGGANTSSSLPPVLQVDDEQRKQAAAAHGEKSAEDEVLEWYW
jgi:hypothetical protein